MRKLSDADIISFFWNNVEKTDTCWNWKGKVLPNGTPLWRKFMPKKLSLFLVGRNTDDLRIINHTCGNKLCVNPDHLIVGINELFWSKVIKTDNCWIWIGQKRPFGYGKFQYSLLHKKHHLDAHRFSYLITYGSISEGECVRHTCDNPSCVRPDHLILGSQSDNIQDKVVRDRQAKGSQHGNSKLTEQLVSEIRNHHHNGMQTKELTILYSVSRNTIQNVVNGKAWKHVK